MAKGNLMHLAGAAALDETHTLRGEAATHETMEHWQKSSRRRPLSEKEIQDIEFVSETIDKLGWTYEPLVD